MLCVWWAPRLSWMSVGEPVRVGRGGPCQQGRDAAGPAQALAERSAREISWEGWDPPQPVLCEVEIPPLPGPAGG